MTIYSLAGLAGLLSEADYAASAQEEGPSADQRIGLAIAAGLVGLVAKLDEGMAVNVQGYRRIESQLEAQPAAIHALAERIEEQLSASTHMVNNAIVQNGAELGQAIAALVRVEPA